MSARKTKDYTLAAKRLAEVLGYTMESEGRFWRLRTPGWPLGKRTWHPGTLTGFQCLGTMLVAATWSAPAGAGMSYAQAADICRLDRHPDLIPGSRRLPDGWEAGEIIRMVKAGIEAEAAGAQEAR